MPGSKEKEALVVFTPLRQTARPLPDRHTAAAGGAFSLGVDIDSVCGGRGLCGRCQVLLSEGDFAKHGIDLVAARPFIPFQPGLSKSTRSGVSRLASGRRLVMLGARSRATSSSMCRPTAKCIARVVRKEADARCDIER
jgi:uncharacterized 2Fe-2S/4Fe-4S cluster protein (DUF4445 family)